MVEENQDRQPTADRISKVPRLYLVRSEGGQMKEMKGEKVRDGYRETTSRHRVSREKDGWRSDGPTAPATPHI